MVKNYVMKHGKTYNEESTFEHILSLWLKVNTQANTFPTCFSVLPIFQFINTLSFEWYVHLETSYLLKVDRDNLSTSQGIGKVCVHSTLHKPHKSQVFSFSIGLHFQSNIAT